jgi:hypothetical protein
MGILKAHGLEMNDAGWAACEGFYRKHRRLPDDCSKEDMAECVPMAAKYMSEFGWGHVDKIGDRMLGDLEDAICHAVAYWGQ